jgi:hypothetical protein
MGFACRPTPCATSGDGAVLAEYRGYGGNPGLPTESGLVLDPNPGGLGIGVLDRQESRDDGSEAHGRLRKHGGFRDFAGRPDAGGPICLWPPATSRFRDVRTPQRQGAQTFTAPELPLGGWALEGDVGEAQSAHTPEWVFIGLFRLRRLSFEA